LSLVAAGDARRDLLPRPAALVGALAVRRPPAAVAGAKGDYHGGVARGQGGRRMQHDRAVRSAAVAVRREEAKAVEAEDCGRVADGGRFDVVEAEPVDVAERETRVVERGPDRRRSHLGLAHAEMLRERGLTDADDGGGVGTHESG